MKNNRFDAIRNLTTEIDIENHKHIQRMDSMLEEFLGLVDDLEDAILDEEHLRADTNTDKETWTSERFANEILTDSIRSIYKENHGQYIEDIYKIGADIMNITSGMNIRCQPYVKHIFWFAGNIRLFGINLFSKKPAPTVVGITEDDITEEEVKEYASPEDFTSYPQYSQLVFRSSIPIEQLKSLFEEIYLKRSSLTDG